MTITAAKIIPVEFRIAQPTFQFKRRELKYAIFDDVPIDKMIEIIHSFFPIAPYRPDVFPTFIQTTWCETPDWFVLREYLERGEFRYKLRVRRYGSRDALTDKCFVEIKTKTEYEKISCKYRFMCPFQLIPDLFDGVDIRGKIKNLNRDVRRFDILYDHARRMIIEQGFRPLVRAYHARAYFQFTRDDPIRLTLDGFVKFTYLPDKRSFTERFHLLETKLRGGADLEKLDELIVATGAQRVWRFSKFHRALKIFIPDVFKRIKYLL